MSRLGRRVARRNASPVRESKAGATVEDALASSGISKDVAMVFHRPPESVSQAVLTLWMSAALEMDILRRKLPGTSLPFHVVVEMGGQTMCGEIVSAEEADRRRSAGEKHHAS